MERVLRNHTYNMMFDYKNETSKREWIRVISLDSDVESGLGAFNPYFTRISLFQSRAEYYHGKTIEELIKEDNDAIYS